MPPIAAVTAFRRTVSAVSAIAAIGKSTKASATSEDDRPEPRATFPVNATG